MSYLKWLPLAVCCFAAIPAVPARAAETANNAVDIRDAEGHLLIAADHIVSYDWPTHTLSLALGQRARLVVALRKSNDLVSGIPFTVAAGGKVVYAGKFTTTASSFSFPTPVIVVDSVTLEPKLSDDQLRIQLGYPTPKFFRGEDPRGDQRLRGALRTTGKLAKAPPEYTQWITDSLLEMQSIKRGMTRADLQQVFQEEGGLSTRTERRYAYRDCPSIKVNVSFEPVESLDDKHINHPADKIRNVSQPFLEWTIND
ncbi:MAG: hypothetical protein ABIU95_00025 [Burkholderiales bacterium]